MNAHSEGWLRLAEEVSFPVLIETHHYRMTTDLHFTLDLLDAIPGLPLLADLSHHLVDRAFAWRVPDENHSQIKRVLENSWALHGRVARREQFQIGVSSSPTVGGSVPGVVAPGLPELAEARRR